MPTETPRWEQQRLMPVLATLVKAELTLHYDGPRGTLDAGYRIRDVLGDELLAMGAIPLTGIGQEARSVASMALWLDQMAHTYLSPF